MDDLKPELGSASKFSTIWIIPLVALAIGVYMVIHGIMTEGPTITISFNSAEGLEAGKTKVRYRDVDVGQVESVALGKKLKRIVATVKIDLDAKSMLREDTRFWVVRARIGTGAISGIGTILSGAYIQLEPGAGAAGKRDFVGLEEPALTPGDAPGLRLVLTSDSAGSVSAGDAILFHGYKVGRIEAVTFNSTNKQVMYDAFIDAPYDELVTTTSRFWNISGISFDVSAAGVRVSTGSLETVLLGGVTFDTLPGLQPGEKASSGARYKLAANFQELQADPYQYGTYYVTQFTQSLRGLDAGAPVEYRGIQVGYVERILFKELMSERLAAEGTPIPVLIYLEPGRLGMTDDSDSVDQLSDIVTTGIIHGLRTSLQTGSLLTGKLLINMDYYPEAEAVAPAKFEDYPVIPSIPSGLGRLEQQLGSLLDKLKNLPLENTVARANTVLGTMDGTMAALTKTLDSANHLLGEESTVQLTHELSQTLAQLRKTLAGLAPGSAASQSLGSSIYELNSLLRNLQNLTRTLSDKPNAVLFPTQVPADPIPEARAQ